MKQRILFLFLLSLYWIHGEIVSAQTTMILEMEDAETEMYDLTTLHKVTFSEDIFTLNFTGGQHTDIDIESISKVLFTVPTSIEKLVYTENKPQLFPNPAGEYIYIKYGNEQSVNLSIVSLEGKTIISYENIPVSGPISIAFLPSGFYLIKINHYTVKLHKI